MTQVEHHFRVVRRGYDPAEVDRTVAGLEARIAASERKVEELRVRVLEAEAAASSAVRPASFEHLGERVGRILSLAEEEASELRDQVRTEVETQRKDSQWAASVVRDQAARDAARATAELEIRLAERRDRTTAEIQEQQAATRAELEAVRADTYRLRADSDRELAEAGQRRDSINAQLSNVRQMLASLSGSATGFAVDPLPDVPVDEDADSV